MGYPTSVGVIWHLSDAVAVRPEVNLTTSTTNVSLSSTSATAYGVGVSALFYVKHWDALRAYERVEWSKAAKTISDNWAGVSTTM